MHKDSEHPADENPGAKDDASQYEKDKQKRTGIKVRAWQWWALVATLLAFLAQYVEGFDHKFVSPSLVVAFLVFVASAVAFWIQFTNHHGHRWGAYLRAAFIVLLGLLVCGALFWHDQMRPRPHLTLYLHSEDSPDINLVFTNKSLFTTHDENGFLIPKETPFLVAEVPAIKSGVVLKFGIMNGPSPSFAAAGDAALVVDAPEISLWMTDSEPPGSLVWSADSSWKPVSVSKDMPGRVLNFRFPDSLLPGCGATAAGITFDMQGGFGGAEVVAVMVRAKGISPAAYFFKLAIFPSDRTTSRLHFDTDRILGAHWKYRPVAYRPLNGPLTVSPERVQLADGTNTLGTKAIISNPTSSNVYAVTASVEVEHAAVPMSSLVIDLSKPKERPKLEPEPQVDFESRMDMVSADYQLRLFIIPLIQPGESRTLWIRGTSATNSFADISIWQEITTFPTIKYDTNGQWLWPVVSSNSPFWKHTGAVPIDLDVGIQMDYGSNRIKIPSHP